jgi:Tol biopolymer transport system component
VARIASRHARRLRVATIAATVLTAGGCASIVRASVDTAGGDPNNSSNRPSISADGRYVAFYSDASDLVPGDGNGAGDVFVRDVRTQTTTRVSVDTGGGDANGGSSSPSISADGRYVAFDSIASDLVPNDGNEYLDVFVRDLQTETTARVSVGTAGDHPNTSGGGFPSISADGRYVAFESWADDLVPDDSNDVPDVFVRDLQSRTTTRVSVDIKGGDADALSGGLGGNGPSISADGRYVAFRSLASDLVPGDGNDLADVFVRDLQSGTTVRASVDTAGHDPDGESTEQSISADGRYVAFASVASDLVTGDSDPLISDVFVRDLQAGTTTWASPDDETWCCAPAYGGSISADGRYVVFGSSPSVFVRDVLLGRTVRVDRNLFGGLGDSAGGAGSISGNGRYVAFSSLASNLVPGDRNRNDDVFVKYARVVTVSGISPTHVAAGATNLLVTIRGSGFEPGNRVQVHRGGSGDLTLDDVTVVSDDELTARLSIPAGTSAGAWDVRGWQTDGFGFAVGQCGGCLQVT